MPTDAQQLDLLMDYTKFHIGIYTSVMTLLLGLVAIGADQTDSKIPSHYRWPLFFVAVLFAVTGGFAGIVAASIPNHDGTFLEYWNGPIRIIGFEWSIMTVGTAARLEHLCFWLAAVSSLVIVAYKGFPWRPQQKAGFSVAGVNIHNARSVRCRCKTPDQAKSLARAMLAQEYCNVTINDMLIDEFEASDRGA